MTRIIYTLLFITLISIIASCKKEETKSDACFSNAITSRQIINKPATIREYPAGTFYMIEQGTIDTKLQPCNLPPEFRIDRLQVTVSGDVKGTIQNPLMPCCTEDFVITKIAR